MAHTAQDKIEIQVNGQTVTLRKDKEAVAGFVDRGSNYREEPGGFLLADRWVAYLNERRNPDRSSGGSEPESDSD